MERGDIWAGLPCSTKSDRQELSGDVGEPEIQGGEPWMECSSLLSEGSRHVTLKYVTLAMEYFELKAIEN